MRALTLRLPDEVHEALRREAFESRRSMNEVVLTALGSQAAIVDNFVKMLHRAEADAWDKGFVASETHKDYVAMEDQPWRVTHPTNPYREGSK